MALAMTSSSTQPPSPHHRRRRRSQPTTATPNANSKPKPKPRAKALPLLSDVGVGRDPAAIKYYARVASNLAGAGRLRDFLLAAEGLRAAACNDPSFAARISARLLSRGVAAAVRERGLPFMLEFFRDAERVRVPVVEMLDADASNAVAGACRMLLEERRMVEFVEVVEALARYGFYVQDIVNPMDVLKIFVKQRDPDIAIRYARIFPSSQLLLCNTMEAFGKRKELKNALLIFGALKNQLGGINMFACRSIIDICGHCGSSVQARIIFENLGVPPDLTSYNILLKTCCSVREFNLAQEIYEEMKKKERDGLLKLDVFTYSTMMKVFADAKMWKMASNIKEDMQANGVRLNLVTWSSLINAYANSGLVDRAIEILKEMIRDGCQPTAPCFNIILTACVKSCQYDRAFRLFYSWKESGIKISLSSEQKRVIDGGFTFCKEYPNNDSTILVVPFRPTVTTYNILMKACGTNAERAKSTMNEMRRNGLCPDLISWSILIDIYGSSQNRDGAVQALRRMQRVGMRLNVSAYTVAIKACVENKDLKLALHLFEEMKTHQLKPNLVTYKTLLAARINYGSLQEVQQCLAIYQEMRKAGFQANDYYLKELIVEWCEGVLSSRSDNQDFYNLDLQPETERKESFNLFLEKVVTVLQKDTDQNQIVDVRGLSKVEARIVVLSVLRKIKEQYLLGRVVQDDVVIITGHEKTSTTEAETTTSAVDVVQAIVTVLTDDLGLEVLIGPGSCPPVSSKPKAPTKSRSNLEQISKEFTRRPQGMIKIPINSLNHWLRKKAVRIAE
ncbi:pentatricopeptide repeat-containing protein At5g02830, chloroplastic isoform X2 [Zea mays]|uniref:pentatricopeptide repeat-containing protein At5g02830, chloroplastic isoform X2 n=1 Tax=Zea mays TaxID=4577 RepID=UPI0004DEB9FD|nr:pentatricopeptide repeat-containing protein At5g02830, chloroplastic isoform X2 [Zea mays]|eukprot:XP_008660263.1 pentatricopeptide repeat-containing protein At5g02830, chloroplastic isoform X2 [Zea mays]